jgi:hypothetical protein
MKYGILGGGGYSPEENVAWNTERRRIQPRGECSMEYRAAADTAQRRMKYGILGGG